MKHINNKYFLILREMNVVSNPTSNFIITIIRSLSYFILIWWLLNIYSIKYEIEKLHRIQLYCEGDIMEQETFRYNLYKINDDNNTNKNVNKIKDKIETFKTVFLVFYWLLISLFVILIIMTIFKYNTQKVIIVPYNTIPELFIYIIALSVFYFKMDSNFNVTDDSYNIFKTGYRSRKSSFNKNLDNVLNNYFVTEKDEKIYFMNDGLSTLGDDFAKDLATRAIELDELEQSNNHEVISITQKIQELEVKLFERKNGRVVKVKTELLLPYLQLNRNNARKDNKNDIEIINEAYHNWVCSHDTVKNEPNICIESKNYITQSLNNINTDDNYDDIHKELTSMITIGIFFGIVMFYFIYHSLYKNNTDFRQGVILLNISVMVLLFIYYMIFIRYSY